MSDQRPNRGDGGSAARLLASSRARLAATLQDLAVPPALRLREWQRILVTSLLAKLVGGVEDDLRGSLAARLPEGSHDTLRASLGAAHVPIALPILERSRAFPGGALGAILLRRVEEHRLYRAGSDNALLLTLIGDEDEALAGDAMAVLVAHSARLDPFRDPTLARTELAADLQHNLVWTVAAALRRYIAEFHDLQPADADHAIAGAAHGLLASYDEADGIDALCLRLARRLDGAGRLNTDLIGRALTEGSLPLFLACIATRTGFDSGAAWEIASDPEGLGPVFLLRAAALSREAAGTLLLRLHDGQEQTAAASLDLFDTTSEVEAGAKLALWRFDPAYRSAVAFLSEAA